MESFPALSRNKRDNIWRSQVHPSHLIVFHLVRQKNKDKRVLC